MGKAEAWIEGHEELCAERYHGILAAVSSLTETVTGTKRGISKAVWLGVTTVIGLVGWMGAQMIQGYQSDMHQLKQGPPGIYAGPST